MSKHGSLLVLVGYSEATDRPVANNNCKSLFPAIYTNIVQQLSGYQLVCIAWKPAVVMGDYEFIILICQLPC